MGYLHRYAGYEGTAQGNIHLAASTAPTTSRASWRAARRRASGRRGR
ncbi:hypothetical protein ACFQ3Z_12015 [Streptomyces nogalater]